MTTSKVAGIAVLHAISTRDAGSKDIADAKPPAGWDPFEVWQTRVLESSLKSPAVKAHKIDLVKPTLVRAV